MSQWTDKCMCGAEITDPGSPDGDKYYVDKCECGREYFFGDGTAYFIGRDERDRKCPECGGWLFYCPIWDGALEPCENCDLVKKE